MCGDSSRSLVNYDREAQLGFEIKCGDNKDQIEYNTTACSYPGTGLLTASGAAITTGLTAYLDSTDIRPVGRASVCTSSVDLRR